MKLNRVQRRLREIASSGGAKGIWFAGLAELGYRRVTVREFSLRFSVEQAKAKIDIETTRLGEADADEYNRFRNPSNPGAFSERLRNGDYCFAGRYNGVMVCSVWIATEKAWNAYLSVPIPMTPGEAYNYDLYTSPAWRGMGIPAAVTSTAHKFCREQGFSRVTSVTIPENGPAMQMRTGYRSIGTMGVIRIGKRRHVFQRINPGEQALGAEKPLEPEWEQSVTALEKSGHYLDDFLAQMKRDAYLALIEEWGGVPPGGRVLKTDLFEEAMGPDAFLLDLGPTSVTRIGMDVSEFATSRASTHDSGRKAFYVRADTRSLPFADQSIHMIISPSTLDHFAVSEDFDQSLRELRRVLVPDGRMILTLDNKQNVFDPLLRFANFIGRVPYFLGRSYSISELRNHLANAGFDVRDTTAIVHHPRLTAVASVNLANRIGWNPLIRLVRESLVGMQKLRGSRLQYFSGCFIAALAVPAPASGASPARQLSPRMDRVA